MPAERRHDRLCELNVLEQVVNLYHTVVVQDAWSRGQFLTVHGWIYGLRDGLLLYVLPSLEGRKIKIVIEGARLERKRPAYESVRSGFKVDARNLRQSQFELLRGSLG